MKKILFLLTLFVSGYAFGQDSSTVIYNEIRGNVWMKKHNVPAWQIDGYNYAIRNGDTLARVKGDGTYAAGDLQIYPDGTDQTSKLNAVLNLTKVRAVKISSDSSRPFVVNGSLDAKGRTLIFENGAYITGTGSVANVVVQANRYARIFDTTGLTITNIRTASEVLTPQNFGAKADGTTDDTKATQMAMSVPGVTTYLPNGTYLSKDSLTLYYQNNLDMGTGAMILSDIPQSKKGLIIGSYDRDNRSAMRDKRYRVRIMNKTVSDWSDTTNVGIFAVNINYTDKVSFDHVEGFSVGVKTVGWNGGVASVRYQLGYFKNNYWGLWVASMSITNQAWNNENHYYGGYFTVSPSVNPGMSPSAIVIGNGNYNESQNQFHGPSFEYSRSNVIPVLIQSGTENLIENARSEDNSDTIMHVFPGTQTGNTRNRISVHSDGGRGVIWDESYEKDNKIIPSRLEYSINTSYTTVYEVNSIVDYISYRNDSSLIASYPVMFQSRAGRKSPLDTVANGEIQLDGDYVVFNNTSTNGITTDYIDTRVSKTFVIKQSLKVGDNPWGIYIAAYDSTLNLIPTDTLPGSNFTIVSTSTYGANFTIGTPTRDVRIVLPDRAKYMRVTFGRISSGTKRLKGFKIISMENNTTGKTSLLNTSARVVYSTYSPTVGTWQKGTMILNPASGNTDAGWVVTESGTFDTLQSRTASVTSQTNKVRLSAGTGSRLRIGDYLQFGNDVMRIVAIDADTAYTNITASTTRNNQSINFAVPKIAPLSGGTAVIDTNVVATQAGLTHVKDSILNLMVADTLTANFYQDGDTLRLFLGDKSWAVYNKSTGGSGSYTFTDGLTESSGTVRNDLITGKSGGQTVVGGTASGNDLTLSSTTHGTKGKIKFGANSEFDEANNVLSIGGLGGTNTSGINNFKDFIRFYKPDGSAVRGWLYASDITTTLQGNAKNLFLGLKSNNYMRMDSLGRTLFSTNAAGRYASAILEADSSDGTYASFRIAPGSEPSSKVPGAFWMDKSNNHLKVYDGTQWVDLMDGGGGSMPSFADGYLLRGSGSGADTASGLVYDKNNRSITTTTDNPFIFKRLNANNNNMVEFRYDNGDLMGLIRGHGNNSLLIQATTNLYLYATRISTNTKMGINNAASNNSHLQVGESTSTISSMRMPLGVKPSSGLAAGDFYTDNSDNYPYYYTGTKWYNLLTNAPRLTIDTIPDGTPGTDSILVTNGGVVKRIPANYYSTGTYINNQVAYIDDANYTFADTISAAVLNNSTANRTFTLPSEVTFHGRTITIRNDAKDTVFVSSGFVYNKTWGSAVIAPHRWVTAKADKNSGWIVIAQGGTSSNSTGWYVPSISSVQTLDSATPDTFYYTKNAELIHVWGRATVVTKSSDSFTSQPVDITLPFAWDALDGAMFTDDGQLLGFATVDKSGTKQFTDVLPNTVNNKAKLSFTKTASTSETFNLRIDFNYRVFGNLVGQ